MSQLRNILESNHANRRGDVVFVHGLDGDGRSTWHPNGKTGLFWPAWLAERYAELGIWSLDYDAAALGWAGNSMPLDERATEVLSVLEAYEIGKRPLVFIAHSLGGLLVKRILRNAWESQNPRWKAIVSSSSGIVFLATPNYGAHLAGWLRYLGEKLQVLRVNVTAGELESHNPELRRLNTWFRDRVANNELKLEVDVYYEKLPTRGYMVVDESSANPGLPGVEPIPQDADHISICKPDAKDAVLCLRVNQFIERCFPS